MAEERDTLLVRLQNLRRSQHIEIPEAFQDDDDIISAAIAANCFLVKHASQRLRDDKDMMTRAVCKNGALLEYASQRLRDDDQLVYLACAVGGKGEFAYRGIHDSVPPLQFASERLRGEREVVLLSVKRDGFALRYASPALRDELEIVHVAVKEGNQHSGMDSEVATLQGTALQFASDRFRDDPELVVAAIERDCDALEHASPRLQADADMNLLALPKYTRWGWFRLPRGFHMPFLGNKDFMMLAVEKNCQILSQADEAIRGDRAVVSLAVAQDGQSLQYASTTLRSDPQVCCAAVTRTPTSIAFTRDRSSQAAPNLHPNVALAYAYSVHPGVRAISASMLSMYDEGLCSDVKVVLDDGTVLAAHRAILAARSPVLKAQLLKEDSTTDVHMRGCSRVAADRFLRFLYTGMLGVGGIGRDWTLMVELHTLAKQYDVPDFPVLHTDTGF